MLTFAILSTALPLQKKPMQMLWKIHFNCFKAHFSPFSLGVINAPRLLYILYHHCFYIFIIYLCLYIIYAKYIIYNKKPSETFRFLKFYTNEYKIFILQLAFPSKIGWDISVDMHISNSFVLSAIKYSSINIFSRNVMVLLGPSWGFD